MTDPRIGRLVVTADLQVDVDGVAAYLSGDGDHLNVATDHPYRLARNVLPLVRRVGSGTARSGLRLLADQGLTITVTGPHRDLVQVGAQAGKRHVRLTRPPLWPGGVLLAALALITIRHRRPHEGG